MRILLFSLSSFATGCFITAGSSKWAHPGKDRHSIQYLKFFCQKKDCKKPIKAHIKKVGNGNPLQYSCLENPMDGEAW